MSGHPNGANKKETPIPILKHLPYKNSSYRGTGKTPFATKGIPLESDYRGGDRLHAKALPENSEAHEHHP